jgi:hypothetical protein
MGKEEIPEPSIESDGLQPIQNRRIPVIAQLTYFSIVSLLIGVNDLVHELTH